MNITISSGLLLDGRYKLLRPLSADGGTADVWLALDINTIDDVYDDNFEKVPSEESGIKVAIKIYRPKNALDLGEQRFREEFKIVFNCHHSNLIQPINFSIYEGIPYLVLPYCQRGSSETIQGKMKNADELWKYISDVSAGLAYLHAFNPTIVHHDIKPANVLIDDNGNYAITDFGISSHKGLNPDGYCDSQGGTMAYMAPERFGEDYESVPESDIWSFGATLYEIITGRVPFGEEGGQQQRESGKGCPPITEQIPGDIKKLVYDCLSADISRRPSADRINKAAARHKYPQKNRSWIYITASALVLGAILALLLAWLPREEAPTPLPPVITPEEKYDSAMALIGTADKGSLELGLAMLDTLGAQGYVPALYEEAYTYGWYHDSASVARKKILGIECTQELIPKDKQINIKAIGLFSKIEEIGDPDYPEINANALYRLACYYVNNNDLFQQDLGRAKLLLRQALQWAQKGNDPELLDKIQRNLEQLPD